MSTTAGRVFSGLTRASFSRGICLIHNSTVRRSSVRSLALSSQRAARSTRPTDDKAEVNDEPIKFSTSKASHRTWTVDRSMGGDSKRHDRKILLFSVVGAVFILWCALREESPLDTHLKKPLTDHLPGLFPDQDEESKDQKKSS